MIKEKLFRHIVLFKFKEEISSHEVNNLRDSFMGLSSKIKVIKEMEWGLNESKENYHQGFTHCFILSFVNTTDLDTYQAHPEHLQFQKLLIPAMEKVFVVDYWAYYS